MTALQVTELHIYPVKSCKGISLSKSQLGPTGLQHDRGWMVVDDQHQFMTQRTQPHMSLIETQIINNQLVLSTFGMEDHTVPFIDPAMQRIQTSVFDDPVDAIKIQGETSEWLEQALGVSSHLVGFPIDSIRQCDPDYAEQGEHTQFSDAFPLLILSQAALDTLNSRLDTPVGMNRFRPNIVISGCEAHDEDRWSEIDISGISIRMVKDCARCSVPTVDPDAGILAGPEPIHTLSSYRERNGEVFFGQNAIAEQSGLIAVGDTVTAHFKDATD